MFKTNNLDINIRTEKNICIITLSGSLMQTNTTQTREKLLNHLNTLHPPRIILSLHQLHYIDAYGLAVFVALKKAVDKQTGELTLAGITNPVRTMIELTRLQQTLSLYADEQAAFNYLLAIDNAKNPENRIIP